MICNCLWVRFIINICLINNKSESVSVFKERCTISFRVEESNDIKISKKKKKNKEERKRKKKKDKRKKKRNQIKILKNNKEMQ